MPRRRTESLETHFWAKVNQTEGCWLWLAYQNRNGYGTYFINRRPKYAHRVAWELTYGAIPAGLVVMHKCDTPPCVRPEHLSLGTYGENIADALQKGRFRPGEPRSRRWAATEKRVAELEKIVIELRTQLAMLAVRIHEALS